MRPTTESVINPTVNVARIPMIQLNVVNTITGNATDNPIIIPFLAPISSS